MVEFTLNNVKSVPFLSQPRAKDYNFSKADYTNLYHALSGIDWSYLQDYVDVNMACSAFYNVIYLILDQYVPARRSKSIKHPTWFTRELISNIKLKKIQS
ncbi:hypothetical protein RI129_011909 [Pyrocoelia pectoralis]|uniref:Uncharacterized protein n=1 Tax=Pyrocoelia pectoralis TaxID=417401 RepID=A0AAN7V173_9COLE